MRIMQGSKVVEAPPGWREAVDRDGRPVVVDLGAGDGRYVYEQARRDDSHLYIAIDPDATTLSEYAFRASRKPARGGVENALFVVAAAERLPPELEGLASLVRINFPWGSLLRGLLEPDGNILRNVARMLQPNARFEMLLSYDSQHDTGAFAGTPLPEPNEARIRQTLAPAYGNAGLNVTEVRRLSQEEALEVPSAWGRRLLHARPRGVYFVAGTVSQ